MWYCVRRFFFKRPLLIKRSNDDWPTHNFNVPLWNTCSKIWRNLCVVGTAQQPDLKEIFLVAASLEGGSLPAKLPENSIAPCSAWCRRGTLILEHANVIRQSPWKGDVVPEEQGGGCYPSLPGEGCYPRGEGNHHQGAAVSAPFRHHRLGRSL